MVKPAPKNRTGKHKTIPEAAEAEVRLIPNLSPSTDIFAAQSCRARTAPLRRGAESFAKTRRSARRAGLWLVDNIVFLTVYSKLYLTVFRTRRPPRFPRIFSRGTGRFPSGAYRSPNGAEMSPRSRMGGVGLERVAMAVSRGRGPAPVQPITLRGSVTWR